MNIEQATIIIRESIRQAARECGVKPSEAHKPEYSNKSALAARNIAMRLARDQGIPIHILASAFSRSRDTLRKCLAMSKAD